MDKLFSIRQPITEELALLNKTLTESLHTTSPLMNEVIQAYPRKQGETDSAHIGVTVCEVVR